MNDNLTIVIIGNSSHHSLEVGKIGHVIDSDSFLRKLLIEQNGRTEWLEAIEIGTIEDHMIFKPKVIELINKYEHDSGHFHTFEFREKYGINLSRFEVKDNWIKEHVK